MSLRVKITAADYGTIAQVRPVRRRSDDDCISVCREWLAKLLDGSGVELPRALSGKSIFVTLSATRTVSALKAQKKVEKRKSAK